VLSTHFSHETITHLAGEGRRGTSIALYTFSPYPWEGALILAVYVAVFLVLSYVIYRFKEVKG
jgi:ABC-type transport system involved in multi-copper enzyme maturation permease subunit